jgi:hypothetical protein
MKNTVSSPPGPMGLGMVPPLAVGVGVPSNVTSRPPPTASTRLVSSDAMATRHGWSSRTQS